MTIDALDTALRLAAERAARERKRNRNRATKLGYGGRAYLPEPAGSKAAERRRRQMVKGMLRP